MELTYRTEGDYRLPNLDVPEAPKVGKYGILFLQKRDTLSWEEPAWVHLNTDTNGKSKL